MLKENPGKYQLDFSKNVCDSKAKHTRKHEKISVSLDEGTLEKLNVLIHFAEFGSRSENVEEALKYFFDRKDVKPILEECYRAWEAQGE